MGIYYFGRFWAILDTFLNYFLHCFGLFWDHIISAMGIYCFGLFWIVLGYFGCCLELFFLHCFRLFWAILDTVLNYFLHCFGLFWGHIVSVMGIYCFGLFWIVVGYFGCCLGLFLTLFWTVLGTYFLYKRLQISQFLGLYVHGVFDLINSIFFIIVIVFLHGPCFFVNVGCFHFYVGKN